MTPEEQRALAIECGSEDFDGYLLIVDNSLSTYTAAVEANMRERCAKECERADGIHDHLYAAAIRSLK